MFTKEAQRYKSLKRTILIYLDIRNKKIKIDKPNYEKIAKKYNCCTKTIRRTIRLLQDMALINKPAFSLKAWQQSKKVHKYTEAYLERRKEKQDAANDFLNDVFNALHH